MGACLLRLQSLLVALGGAGLLTGLAFLLFRPFAEWYALGYTQIRLWEGTHTPLYSYLVHWGLFLFLIVSWLVWETRDWMAKTPLSELRKLAPYRLLIQVLLVLLVLLTIGLTYFGIVAGLFNPGLQRVVISIAWFVLPLAAWTAILLLAPSMPDAKRIVLFLVGTGLILTLMVELIVLVGDIGRMNTVFKFYLQVWTFFSIAAAAALGWVLPALPDWRTVWRVAWNAALIVLVAGAALYPMWATAAKIKDRMATNAPHTLDGMAYMAYASYADEWGNMDLNQDLPGDPVAPAERQGLSGHCRGQFTESLSLGLALQHLHRPAGRGRLGVARTAATGGQPGRLGYSKDHGS